MRSIIVFHGNLDSPFFLNEIEYIRNNFEIAAIVTYDSKENVIGSEILAGIPVIDIKPNVFDYFTALLSKWPKSLKDEMRSVIKEGRKPLRCVLYDFFYFTYAQKACRGLKRIIKDLNGSIPLLYSFWLSRSAYAMVCADEKLFDGKAVKVSRAHGYDLYEERNQLHYLPFRTLFANRIDQISFISNNGMNYFAQRYSDRKDNLSLFYMGTENKRGITKRHEKKAEISIFTCSMVIGIKRLDLLIDILKQLDGIPIRWTHVGDGELSEDIRQYAESNLKNRSIKYELAGKLDNSRILVKMDEVDADFLFNTSDSEGLPVTMMEALSFGIPIVARNVGGVGEIVGEDCGMLIDMEAPDMIGEIKDYIMTRLSDENEYYSISGKCLEKWNERFNAGVNYPKFFEHIARL